MSAREPRPRLRVLRSVARLMVLPTVLVVLTCAVLSVGVGEGAASLDGDGPGPAGAARPAGTQIDLNEACLIECHADPDLTMTFPSGEVMSLYRDMSTFQESVHGSRLDCIDCHQRHRTYPHPSVEVWSRRDYARSEYEVCKRCHFDNYTRTIDSVHFDAMAGGNADAAICTDCHTAHNVMSFEDARVEIGRTCSNCHGDIYREYSESVHGAALLEDNPDVPDCVVCHGVHNIEDPETSAFRQGSVDLCAECHADKDLMDKYGISSNVVNTYLDDFHGKTAGFNQKQDSEIWPGVAVCSDCHGVHDIKSVDDPDSSVVKENLTETCRKCHDDATSNFPSAWLSHYEPSITKWPLVFFIVQYYRFLIPVLVGGLALNVVLDLWRLARNR